MLDYVVILNSGGLVFFEKNFSKKENLKLMRNLLKRFIREIFLE